MFLWNKHKEKYNGEIKTEVFNLPDISAYSSYKMQEKENTSLSEQTYSDLGIEELFSFADRTVSRIGQQYLYHILRYIPGIKGEIEENEKIITQIETNSNLRDELTQALSSLQDNEAYSIAKLFTNEHPVISKTIATSFTFFRFLPALFLTLYLWGHVATYGILFLIAIFLNAGIHYFFKPKSLDYLYSVPQFIKLMNCTERICKLKELSSLSKDIPEALMTLNPLRKASLFLRIESKLQGDMDAIVWMVTELTHIFFLTEPVSFIRSVGILRNKSKEMEQLYRFIGLTDCLLSVYHLRSTLPYYCLPECSESNCRLAATDMYHPLIPDCVANSVVIEDKSVLLSGSNMSGKTTFIRITGLNAFAAQTLHTAFARTYKQSTPLYIYSALMLADNLFEGKSFYMKELETIKNMINQSRQGCINLFLFDEIFKGTNTTERIAAAKAVLSYLNTPDNIIVISTHDTELAILLENEYDLYHFSEIIQEDTFSFDYKLQKGPLYQRNAIRLLEINGFPKVITDEAYRTAISLSEKQI